MATAPLFTLKAKEAEKLNVPASFGKEVSLATIAQAFHVYREESHTGRPMVQTRGMVTLTKKKMYRQKHTGNARHSTFKAPIFVGGGVTHGPKGVKSTHTLSRVTRDLAKHGSLSFKLAKNELAFIDVEGVKKTKDAATLVTKAEAKTIVVVLSKENWNLARLFKNIKGVSVFNWETFYAYPALTHKMVLVDSSIVETKKAEKPAKKEVKAKTK